MKYEQFLDMLSKHGCLQEYSESLPNEVKTQILLALDGDWLDASRHAEELFEKQRSAKQFMQTKTSETLGLESNEELPELPEGF